MDDSTLIACALRARNAELQEIEWPPRRGTLCPFDLAAMVPGDVAVRLTCGHVAHANCIFPFLRAHPRNRPRFCPLDGVEIPNTLSATRLRVVTLYDPVYHVDDATSSDIQLTDDVCMRWLDTALHQAEVRRAFQQGDQLSYLSARSARLMALRRTFLSRFPNARVPPEETLSVGGEPVPFCDNSENCASSLASRSDYVINGLPCAHWLCVACDSPRRLRCPACSALRPSGDRTVRWSVDEAYRRENRRLRCGELALQRVEAEMESSSQRNFDVPRRYAAFLTHNNSNQSEDDSLRFTALLQHLRSELEGTSNRTPAIEVPLSTVPPEIREIEAWTPPSPGTSPTEGMTNLAVGLRQLLIPSPREPPQQNETVRDDAPDASPVTDDDTHVCVIDLHEIERGERVIRLPCMHIFHAECILGYLRSAPRPQCPLDRIDVPRRVINTLPIFTWGGSEVADADA